MAQERAQRRRGRAAPALGDLDLLAGARGLGGEAVEPVSRAGRPRSARSSAGCSRKCAITTRCGRSSARAVEVRIASITASAVEVAGLDPLAHLARVRRAFGERDLVVGGVDGVDAVDAVRAGRARRVVSSSLASIPQRSSTSVSPRSRGHRRDVLGHPVGATRARDRRSRARSARAPRPPRCCPRSGPCRRRTSSARACRRARSRRDLRRVALQVGDVVEGEEALLEEAHHRDVLERQRAVGDRRPRAPRRSPAAACRRPRRRSAASCPGSGR